MSFKFHPEIRVHVKAIVELMEYANSRDGGEWSGDIYGHASKALDAIVLATMGDKVMYQINHSRYGWNFGGNRTWLDDVEVAVQAALDAIKEENETFDEE